MVERGEAQSRAEIVKKALMKYERQVLAERDAEVYRTTPDDPDMMALAEWSARQPMSELD